MRLKVSTCGPNLVPISESFGTFLAKKTLFPLAAQREGAYMRYKYRAKRSPNGVGIKTPLQSIPVVGPSKITRELLTKTTALLVDMHECTFQAV